MVGLTYFLLSPMVLAMLNRLPSPKPAAAAGVDVREVIVVVIAHKPDSSFSWRVFHDRGLSPAGGPFVSFGTQPLELE